MNKIFYFVALFLSILFLFTLRTDEFLGSSILSYVLTTISIFIILSFFYFYASFYKEAILYQLKELQKKTANSWYEWFSVNFAEFTNIFLFTSPYVIVSVSLMKGLTYLIPALSFLNFIAIGTMVFYCMMMVFVMLSFTFHSMKSKNKTVSQ